MSLRQTLHATFNKVKYTAVIVDEVIPETVHNRLRGEASTSVQQIHDAEFLVETPSHTVFFKKIHEFPLSRWQAVRVKIFSTPVISEKHADPVLSRFIARLSVAHERRWISNDTGLRQTVFC
jgi:hypothetical protein